MFDILAALAGFLPWVPGAIAVVGGLVGLGLIASPPRSDRPDRGDAKGVAGLLAALVGIAGFFVLVPAIFDADATPFIIVTAIGAVLVGGVGFLAGIGGYALLARPGIGRRALAGAVLGPVLFSAATLALRPIGAGLGDGAKGAAMSEHAREIGLVPTIEDLDVTMGTAHDTGLNADVSVVDAVTVVFTVRTDIELGRIYLRLYRPDYRYGSPFYDESIETIDVGTVNWRGATFRKVSEYGNLRHPGEWMLQLYAHDAAGRAYQVLMPLTLGAS